MILKEEEVFSRDVGKIALVVEVLPSQDFIVRKVKVKLGNGTLFERPITKIVVLVEND